MTRSENTDLPGMRREYDGQGLDEAALPPDPITQFHRWFDEAFRVGDGEPNAMVLSTVDENGWPRQRSVLLKGVDERGFVFFTNYESDKARQIALQPRVNLLFGWYRAHRQVIVAGAAERVARHETDEYFARRPRGAQLAAWASAQSRPVSDRGQLESAYAAAERRFDGLDVPAPPHWGGFRVVPTEVEFWQGRRDRLHDRLRFRRNPAGVWGVERFSP